jgi:hypothetical protein
MNERILDIAIKSGHIVGNLPLNANEKIQLAGLEKFAELIIRECALTLESITVPVSQCYEDFDNGYNKALLTGSTVIKQHFGVEE